LLTTLDTDVPKACAILMRVLRPFTLTPDGNSYRISGALDLSAVVGPGVSDSSAGALPDYSETAWIPLDLRTSGPAGRVEVVS
jgi:hypothetical protein